MLQVVVRVGPHKANERTILHRDGDGKIVIANPERTGSMSESVRIVIVRSNDWIDQPLELDDGINPSVLGVVSCGTSTVCGSCLSGLASFFQ